MLESIPFLDEILKTIQNAVDLNLYIDQAADFVKALGFLEKVIVLLVGIFVVFLGVLELLKKLSKLLIVGAVIFGLWILYSQGYLDAIIGG